MSSAVHDTLTGALTREGERGECRVAPLLRLQIQQSSAPRRGRCCIHEERHFRPRLPRLDQPTSHRLSPQSVEFACLAEALGAGPVFGSVRSGGTEFADRVA